MNINIFTIQQNIIKIIKNDMYYNILMCNNDYGYDVHLSWMFLICVNINQQFKIVNLL